MTNSEHPVTSPFPERVTLELTNRCNLSCPVCPRQHMDYPQGFMDSRLFKKVVDELAELGTGTLVPFFRGEPLLHPECVPMLAYAKRKGLKIQLATNGTLLSRETAQDFVKMGLDFVSFSVDSVDPEVYRGRRQGSTFEALMDGFNNLYAARKNASGAPPAIQVSAVDSGMTPAEKKEFSSFWNGRADRIRIYPQHTADGRFGSLENNPTVPRQSCLKSFREMVLYWDGRAALCNHDWNNTSGPLVSEHGIIKAWRSPWYDEMRRCQHERIFPPGIPCQACGHWPQYAAIPTTLGEILTP